MEDDPIQWHTWMINGCLRQPLTLARDDPEDIPQIYLHYIYVYLYIDSSHLQLLIDGWEDFGRNIYISQLLGHFWQFVLNLLCISSAMGRQDHVQAGVVVKAYGCLDPWRCFFWQKWLIHLEGDGLPGKYV